MHYIYNIIIHNSQLSLKGDVTQTDMPNHSSGFILLETNYRVIAYTGMVKTLIVIMQ